MYMCFLNGVFFPATITFIYRFPKLRSNKLKLEKIVYWTFCWWRELVILENQDNDKTEAKKDI